MSQTIDQLLGALSADTAAAPAGLESAVWSRIAYRREAHAEAVMTLKTQIAVACVALSIGVAFGQMALPIATASLGASNADYSETLVLSDDASLTPSMKL